MVKSEIRQNSEKLHPGVKEISTYIDDVFSTSSALKFPITV